MKRSSGSLQQRTVKHVPQRTCIACREVKPKRDLIRLVYTREGVVEVDITGKKPGRGAYLCRSPECWHKGISKGRLEHALRGKISPDNRAILVKYGIGLHSSEATPSHLHGESK